MDQVTVKTLKGFNNEGRYVPRRTTISVSEIRARELEANGLVERSTKKAPEPANKMEAEPENKRRGKKNESAPSE